MPKKTPAQLQADIDQALARPAQATSGHRGSLTHRLESVESELRRLKPRDSRRRDLTEERDDLRRQVAGRPAALPRWSDKRGWHGGDHRTLYWFSWARPYYAGAPDGGGMAEQVYPGGHSGIAADRHASVRVATRDEATRLWQDPLHVGWNVTG